MTTRKWVYEIGADWYAEGRTSDDRQWRLLARPSTAAFQPARWSLAVFDEASGEFEEHGGVAHALPITLADVAKLLVKLCVAQRVVPTSISWNAGLVKDAHL